MFYVVVYSDPVVLRSPEKCRFASLGTRLFKRMFLCRSVTTCSVSTSPFVAVVRDAITAHNLQGAVITWETVSRSGTAATSSIGAMSMSFQKGQIKGVNELTVCMAGVPVVTYPAVGNQEFPLVVSSVTGRDGILCSLGILLHLLLLLTYSGVSAGVPWLMVLVLLFPSCTVSVPGGVEGIRSRPHSGPRDLQG